MRAGDRIKRAREAAGLSRAQLGKVLKVSRQTIHTWESPEDEGKQDKPTSAKNTRRSIGERIWDARDAAGLTQVELAERLNVSRETVINWETGKTEPSGNDLVVVEAWLAEQEGRPEKGTLTGGDESAEEQA